MFNDTMAKNLTESIKSLSEARDVAIIAAHASGTTVTKIAEDFDVSRQLVHRVLAAAEGKEDRGTIALRHGSLWREKGHDQWSLHPVPVEVIVTLKSHESRPGGSGKFRVAAEVLSAQASGFWDGRQYFGRVFSWWHQIPSEDRILDWVAGWMPFLGVEHDAVDRAPRGGRRPGVKLCDMVDTMDAPREPFQQDVLVLEGTFSAGRQLCRETICDVSTDATKPGSEGKAFPADWATWLSLDGETVVHVSETGS